VTKFDTSNLKNLEI